MGKLKTRFLAGTILLGMANALAQPQSAMRVRGAVTGFDGHVLQVKPREGSHGSEQAAQQNEPRPASATDDVAATGSCRVHHPAGATHMLYTIGAERLAHAANRQVHKYALCFSSWKTVFI